MSFDANTVASLTLARTDGVGPATYRRLLERYGTATRALAHMPELARRAGRAKPLTPPSQQRIDAELEAIARAGAHLLVWGQPHYPHMLAALDDAPAILTVIGNIALLDKPVLGLVGSRNASLSGIKFAEQLARVCGQAGYVCASGLARGIDTAVHQASLSTGTLAVVAGGVDVIYPPENKNLWASIKDNGTIIAEMPWGTPPTQQHFPRRNRIISGLARGIVIVEGTLKSGSLITARMAAEQGREVMAVPGHPFDPRAAGPNALIRDGATLITSPQDVLDTLSQLQNIVHAQETQSHITTSTLLDLDMPDPVSIDTLKDEILAMLGTNPVDVDSLIQAMATTASHVQSALLELELGGHITRLPGHRVSLNSDYDRQHDEFLDIRASLL